MHRALWFLLKKFSHVDHDIVFFIRGFYTQNWMHVTSAFAILILLGLFSPPFISICATILALFKARPLQRDDRKNCVLQLPNARDEIQLFRCKIMHLFSENEKMYYLMRSLHPKLNFVYSSFPNWIFNLRLNPMENSTRSKFFIARFLAFIVLWSRSHNRQCKLYLSPLESPWTSSLSLNALACIEITLDIKASVVVIREGQLILHEMPLYSSWSMILQQRRTAVREL